MNLNFEGSFLIAFPEGDPGMSQAAVPTLKAIREAVSEIVESVGGQFVT